MSFVKIDKMYTLAKISIVGSQSLKQVAHCTKKKEIMERKAPRLLFRQTSKEIYEAIETRCKKDPVSMGEFVHAPSQQFGDEFMVLLGDTGEDGKPTSSVIGSTFTLTNTILGSGTLAVPYALASSGWMLGQMIMLAIALVTRYSVQLLLIASDLAGENCAKTYESLGSYTMGRYGTWLAEFTFIFGGFGTIVSYLIFITDLLCATLGLGSDYKKIVMVASTVAFIMPLSLNRKIGKLQITSLLATLSVSYVVLFVLLTFVVLPESGRQISAFRFDSNTIYTVTLLIAAFACHNTTLPVYEELKDRTLTRMGKAVNGAICIAFILYSIIGNFAYLSFGQDTKDNVLLNYKLSLVEQHPHLHAPLMIGRGLMAIALLLTCPIALWPFRSCMLSVYLRHRHGSPLPSSAASRVEFISMTLITEFLILICAMYVPNVRTPLSIVGSVSGSLIIFIMPSLFYMLQQKHPVLHKNNRGPLALFFSGIVIGIVGLTLTLYKILH